MQRQENLPGDGLPVERQSMESGQETKDFETSRAGITRIGCEGSLSASPRRVSAPKHPCFVWVIRP
jgi:hypothetical protein